MLEFVGSAFCLPCCSAIPFSLFKMSRRAVCAGSAVLLLLAAAACPRAAGQTTPSFVVNTNADDAGTVYSQCGGTTGAGTCSLRDALAAASNAGSGNITFDGTVFASSNSASANTIVLANGELDIPATTTITGPAPVVVNGVTTPVVTVSGNRESTVFEFEQVTRQPAATATIANLSITNGNSEDEPGGGIYNSGTLTVTDCTFSNNSAGVAGSGGGISSLATLMVTGSTFSDNSANYGGGIYNAGTLTVTGSTFSNSSANYGGGIYSAGTLTVTGSTFSNDSSGNVGGGIAIVGAAATVTGSTFSHNSASSGGGGIYRCCSWDITTLALANNILDGNAPGDLADGSANLSLPAPIDSSGSCSGVALCNAGGNVVGIYNSQRLNPVPISVTPLGNYGGPTQTMIPLPGSPAICTGTATQGGGLSLPATDQRGDPRTNTSYSGYSSSSPCVDAGAVQTNYSVDFTTEPEPIAPATDLSSGVPFQAAVTLDESGVAFGAPPETAPSVTIPLTFAGNGTLTGGSAGTVKGVATYPALQVQATEPDTDDTLTANLTLNSGAAPVPAVSAQSEPFTVQPPAAYMVTPTPGSTLGGASVDFIWNEAAESDEYLIRVGTNGPGSLNIYNGSPIAFSANPSATVSGIPTNGAPVYVTLGYKAGGTWQLINYTYTAYGTPTPPSMATPTPGSTLSGASVTFTWNKGAGSSDFLIRAGTNGPGSLNIYNGSPIAFTANPSATVSGIPTNGAPVYVTLGYKIGGTWQLINYTYTAASPSD
jgi:large repetitive protein